MQLNMIDSQANEGRHNLGAWFDAETRSGRYRQNYGAFRFEPDMSWGYVPINRDLLGGYYRVNYSSQQWSWALGLDGVSSVTGRGLDADFLTGNARYQVDRSLGVGGGGTMRHGDTDAGAIYGFIDKQSLFGTTRMQVDLVASEGAQRGEQVTVDHAWPTQVGLRLSTSLAFARETTAGVRTTRASVAAFGGIDLTNTLTLEGNLTVLLDGRFATRTNNDGRFEFPFVASGPHSLSVIPDNLALPYSVANEGKREVLVRTRETTSLEIAAVKPQ